MKLFEEIYTGYRGMSGGSDEGKNFWEPGEFDKLTSKKSVGKWYSSDPEVAEWYGDGKVIKNTLEFDDPMIVDAEGSDYHNIQIDGKRYNSDKLSLMAHEDGHDGLVIENVKDPKIVADTYVALKPNTIKESKLFEQIYRSSKLYYHISPNKFDKFERRNSFRKGDGAEELGGTFLTPQLYMINAYFANYLSTKHKRKEYYLYYCKLKKDLNIFNPSSKKDRTLLIDKIRENPNQFFLNYSIKQPRAVLPDLKRELASMFRSHNWSQIENPELTKMIKSLGFDGYVSQENEVGNIMVFDPTNIEIVRSKSMKAEDLKDSWSEKAFSKDEYEQINDRYKWKDEKENRWDSVDDNEFNDLKYTTSDIYEITTDTDLEPFDLLSMVDNDGKIITNKMRDVLDPAIHYAKKFFFDGKEFDSVNELEKHLVKTFGKSDKEWGEVFSGMLGEDDEDEHDAGDGDLIF